MNTILDNIISNFNFVQEPESLNEGILGTINNSEHSILLLGLGLVKIKKDGLYKDLGFMKMSSYILYLVKTTKKDRSCIYNWLHIGEIYVKYREKLIGTGFTSKDGPTKLTYLERALSKNPQKEVYRNLIGMTHRDFADYAKGIDRSVSEIDKRSVWEEKEDEWGYSFEYNEEEAVRVNKKLGIRELVLIISCVKLAFNSLKKSGYVVALHVNNYKECEKFAKIASKAREKMWKEMSERRKKRLQRR